ncbi:FkbM family methyltransferase [Pelagovum pacificum]|uniref:FkbM family methyltransferase n=1 Tax=Pelagovum pacificum TaxID=2588711 RepID=A0A5C5GCG4_9RHOB|nr:FkbM family methyltransferase [Pelagovum pacificum]QQA44690.1 FkbM family methyltransferase [Pelagovum pacificum]TNY32200.1 FkbM family methyltransferase [Pelagovum pacificum]
METQGPSRDLHPAVEQRIGTGASYLTPRRSRVVISRSHERPVYFTVNNRKDRIHATHMKGLFYEQSQLPVIRDHFPEGGVFADVGANVGNHSLYMLMFGGASKVIPFEMNPDAIDLYLSNIFLNGLQDMVELDTLGYGLGDRVTDNAAVSSPHKNLGWARVDLDGSGDVPVRTGDSLLDGRAVDFIKMDVEGMEIAALRGLEKTISSCRPVLFIEVDNKNRDAFEALMEDWSYEVVQAFGQSRVNQNFLLKPAEKPLTTRGAH